MMDQIKPNPDQVSDFQERKKRMVKAIIILGLVMEFIVVIIVLISGDMFEEGQLSKIIQFAFWVLAAAIIYHLMMKYLIQNGELHSAEPDTPDDSFYLNIEHHIHHTILELVFLWLPIRIVTYKKDIGNRNMREFQLLFIDEEIVLNEDGKAVLLFNPSFSFFHNCLLTKRNKIT